jgi:hypothetical protein
VRRRLWTAGVEELEIENRNSKLGGKGRRGNGDVGAVDSFQLSVFSKTREIIAGRAGRKSKREAFAKSSGAQATRFKPKPRHPADVA